jgi:hypothetical protein
LAQRLHLEYPLLGDPDHAGYDAFGLARDGWFNLIGRPLLERPVSAIRDIAGADLKASASPRSDVQRLGGVGIVDRAGVLRWLHRAERSDDLPPNARLLAALDAL